MGMVSVTLFVFFALFRPVLLYTAEEEERFNRDCMVPFSCGKLGEIKVPYTNTTRPDYCGPFVVDGCDKEVQKIQFVRGGRQYEIEGIYQGDIISINDEVFNNLLETNSCESFNDLHLPKSPYFSLQIIHNLTLFKCQRDVGVGSQFEFKYESCNDFTIYYDNSKVNTSLQSLPPNNCSTIQLPANKSNGYHDIFRLLTANFSLALTWDRCAQCHFIGGKCKNIEGNVHCANDEPQRGSRSLRLKLGVAASAAGVGFIISILCYFILHNKKETGDNQTMETFLRNYGCLAPKRYTYSEVKKMTEFLKDKLGQGGFGSVFKGKLPDGRLVAVKVLKESKSNGEEFINEVSSISRTSHVNIVTLLGFCFEGSKRALIYEFMSNGSLEKHIYDENPSRANRRLGWATLYQIAVGIARGLEYLHRGCNTRILHFDIKPHNILLDENFCPKISDFGLAKICTRKESIVSMAVARGTVGYIAPEVFCRNFGRVSHKSDVYSYGMLVLEMVGGRKKICARVDNTSEIYFPHWIHKRLQLGEEVELQGISNEEENKIARKLILASLWCIQTDPSNRPPMSEVVEMLQGRLESLTIPPKPYLSSPPRATHRSIENSSTTIITL